MTRGDYGVIACVFAVVVASFIMAASPGEPAAVSISGPYGVSVIDIDEAAVYRVQGNVGDVVFEVVDGEVRCVESSCQDHICVRSGIVAPGRPVVCAPNGVIASVVGSPEGGLDATSR